MSRWIEIYKTHAYRTTWEKIKETIQTVSIDDESVFHEVNELARLKKVISYIDGILDSLDPELIPINSWDNFEAHAQHLLAGIIGFNTTKQIAQLQSANLYADSLLTFIRPYMATTDGINTAKKRALNDYHLTITKNNQNLLRQIKEIEHATLRNLEKTEDLKQNAQEAANKINSIHEDITNPTDGVFPKIISIEKESNEKFNELCDYYNETLITSDTNVSIKKALNDAKQMVISIQKEIEESAEETATTIADIEKFSRKIYGSKNDENSKEGLANDIDQLYSNLKAFEGTQSLRYKALNEEIEALLPGATSAGLATAYKKLKESFHDPIRHSSYVFYASIGILVIVSLLLTIESFEPWRITFSKIGDWMDVLNSIIYKLPFYAPIVWLAYFASKRRSEYQRLEQEYAHKEALAVSYHSYKKQLEELASSDSSILEDLISRTINAISHNASTTLDKNHGDKSPIHEISEKSIEKLGELAENINKIITSIKK